MTLVAGVDSSTQSTKVLVCDAATGAVVREGRAPHPEGSEVDPEAWWQALLRATDEGSLLEGVEALSIGGQQHGMVLTDGEGVPVRPALLWNDTQSAADARELTAELGGPQEWADAVGLVLVASFTVTKLRWTARNSPGAMERAERIMLPHDWLTWRPARLPRVWRHHRSRGRVRHGLLVGGDRRLPQRPARAGRRPPAGGARGGRPRGRRRRGGRRGPAAVAGGRTARGRHGGQHGGGAGPRHGTGRRRGEPGHERHGVRRLRDAERRRARDVAGFADATGRFLPLVCTLNAARVLDAAAELLGVDHEGLSALALAAPSGADGLVLIPYLDGERTPDLPEATGSLHGITRGNLRAETMARAAVEGMLCGLADGLDALRETGVTPRRVLLIGGAASSRSVTTIAAELFDARVEVPAPAEYVALGAARQAAWALTGSLPEWEVATTPVPPAQYAHSTRENYARARQQMYGQ